MQVAPNRDGGLAIEGLRPGSDARDKGLNVGDVILRAGDHRVSTPADLAAAVTRARQSGRKDVLILVTHDGRNQFVPLSVSKGRS